MIMTTRYLRKALRRDTGLWWGLGGLILGLPLAVGATDTKRLKTLSLEELAQTPVSIATRQPQSVADSAAAVFVVSRDDIRRSGASSIPEALRMVPGLNVARINASTWAVSARGFNGRFANKLLVLMDGRTVYSPLFSGTYWNVQDALMEDIERIEVIRGPGAAAWGANAVNGVINIITRSAEDTRGNLATLSLGDPKRGILGVRHGGALGKGGSYRIYGKYRDQADGETFAGIPAHDAWHGGRLGFRADGFLGANDSYAVLGEWYRNHKDQSIQTPLPQGGSDVHQETNRSDGGHLLGRWSRAHADTAVSTLQVYFDYAYQQESHSETRTLDLDFQHRFAPSGMHQWMLGGGYRRVRDTVERSDILWMSPADSTHQWFSAFIQDQIRLDSAWRLDLGARMDRNDFSGWEFQPSARLFWRLSPQGSLWAAASRAVRTPSRSERNLSALYQTLPAQPPQRPLPVWLVLEGNNTPGFDSEVLNAYELGWRWRLDAWLSLDLSGYYNDYRNLRTIEPRSLRLAPRLDHLTAPLTLGNLMDGHSYGLELAADWRPRPDWRWQLAYTYARLHLAPRPESRDPLARAGERQTPRQQLSLRSTYDLSAALDLDLWLRYTDGLDAPSEGIPAYWSLDIHLAWRPHEGMELALVGQDLLDKAHPEFRDESGNIQSTQIPRGWYLQGRWNF